ncbi:putative porin [Plebeiibacterium sediminum]|uniref:Porin n=1 Tax=Plebeiibacterium sediminum TaxID=2992112 RepID=A0AAE3M855_9BACT|nr:putative porin [Plebeiobacterium sediminum]MCW3788858.1 putative porin [Plebeiobacterium sediminum]
MRTKLQYIIFCLLLSTLVAAQPGGQGRPDNMPRMGRNIPENQISRDTIIDLKDRIWSWKMVDDYTFIDTVAVDTITSGFQNYDPIYKNSFSNINLGNKGGAYTSNLLSYKDDFNEFIFLNSLRALFIQPEDIQFYNTKVPYTNLTYINAGPGRKSEENFTGFFTQNINKDWNLAIRYNLVSSIGLYNAQKVDNRNFNLYSSYHSNKYSMHAIVSYNSIEHMENGGLLDDDHELITDKEKRDQYSRAEDIPVKYISATNKISNFQVFYNHSLGIGKIKLNKELQDSIDTESDPDEEYELPVSTVYHSLHVGNYSRVYKIDDLDNYFDEGLLRIYGTDYVDSLQTRDSTSYTYVKNTFQIKFNEEANSLLKFGVRAFLSNEVKYYKFQKPTVITYDENDVYTPVYGHKDTTLVTTYVGGQVFKNLGKNFWWNLGGKIYVQGYRLGDIDLQGNINSLYRIFKDTAGIYGRGRIVLRSAELFQEKYHSNHFNWDRNFKQEKLVNIELGLKIPTRKLKLSWESKVFTDYMYWNNEALPDQTSDVFSAFQFSLDKDFTFGPLHSDNKLAYQFSSNQKYLPLPEFSGYSSNYFNFYLAKRVLQIQVGVDVKYHSEYYAPGYMPATGQFYNQDVIKVGNYPFMDAFVNLHLKRARVFVKLDHINQSFMDKNYFLTLGYPHAPMRVKWGVSWNFYD